MRNYLKLCFIGLTTLICFASCSTRKIVFLGYTNYSGYDINKRPTTKAKIRFVSGNNSRGSLYNDLYVPNNEPAYPLLTGNVGYGSNVESSSLWLSDIRPASRFFSSHSFSLMTHSHSDKVDPRYAAFCPEGYISECDIKEFEEGVHFIARQVIRRMFVLMTKQNYVFDLVYKRCTPFIADGIREKIKSVEKTSIFTDLGGWQMLKPTEGIDEKPEFYNVDYIGDDWFGISAPGTTDSVFVKVAYAGKFLNPIITGVKNKKMGIDIQDKKYATRHNKKLLVPLDYYYSQNATGIQPVVLGFLGPVVYKNAGQDKLVDKEDLNRIVENAIAKEKAFVHEFYDALLSSGNDVRKIQKQYRYQLVRKFATINDENIAGKNYGVDIFLPCSFSDFAANGYEVAYMGKDCFKVTARKNGESLLLKVVLYGKKTTPAIMGIRNPNQKVDYCPDRFVWYDKAEKQ